MIKKYLRSGIFRNSAVTLTSEVYQRQQIFLFYFFSLLFFTLFDGFFLSLFLSFCSRFFAKKKRSTIFFEQRHYNVTAFSCFFSIHFPSSSWKEFQKFRRLKENVFSLINAKEHEWYTYTGFEQQTSVLPLSLLRRSIKNTSLFVLLSGAALFPTFIPRMLTRCFFFFFFTSGYSTVVSW